MHNLCRITDFDIMNDKPKDIDSTQLETIVLQVKEIVSLLTDVILVVGLICNHILSSLYLVNMKLMVNRVIFDKMIY